jgi:uncharacterized protein (TIGR02391 family)
MATIGAARTRALEIIKHILDEIEGLRALSPAGKKDFDTHSDRLCMGSTKRDQFDAVLQKLTSEGIAEFEESDTGLSWGENSMRVHIPDWKKFDAYHHRVTQELKGDEPTSPASVVNTGTLDALHQEIKTKCTDLYTGGYYPEAVEKGFKVVRDRLRNLTKYETGADAFGKGGLYIKGASAKNVDEDFQRANKFLTMAIDNFRNEKSHTSDSKISDPVRAYEYLVLSSLAMHLLADVKIKKHNPDTPQKITSDLNIIRNLESKSEKFELSSIQTLCMRIFGSSDRKKILVASNSGGTNVFPLGEVKEHDLVDQLHELDGQEVQAHLDELVLHGFLSKDFNKSGEPLYALAKPGFDLIKNKKLDESISEQKSDVQIS